MSDKIGHGITLIAFVVQLSCNLQSGACNLLPKVSQRSQKGKAHISDATYHSITSGALATLAASHLRSAKALRHAGPTTMMQCVVASY